MFFVSALKRTLTLPISLPSWLSPPQAQVSPPVALEPIRFRTPLLAHATLVDSQPSRAVDTCSYDVEAWLRELGQMKLFVEELGEDGMAFHCQSSLVVGQSLQVEVLLRGLGNYQATATVEWTLDGLRGIRGYARWSPSGPASQSLAFWLRHMRQHYSNSWTD